MWITMCEAMQKDLLVEDPVQIVHNRWRWDSQRFERLDIVHRHAVDEFHNKQTLCGLINLRSCAVWVTLEALANPVRVCRLLLKIQFLGEVFLKLTNEPTQLEVREEFFDSFCDRVDRGDVRRRLLADIGELYFLQPGNLAPQKRGLDEHTTATCLPL